MNSYLDELAADGWVVDEILAVNLAPPGQPERTGRFAFMVRADSELITWVHVQEILEFLRHDREVIRGLLAHEAWPVNKYLRSRGSYFAFIYSEESNAHRELWELWVKQSDRRSATIYKPFSFSNELTINVHRLLVALPEERTPETDSTW